MPYDAPPYIGLSATECINYVSFIQIFINRVNISHAQMSCTCPVCRLAIQADKFFSHVSEHDLAFSFPFPCGQGNCTATFVRRRNWSRHIKKYHFDSAACTLQLEEHSTDEDNQVDSGVQLPTEPPTDYATVSKQKVSQRYIFN